MTNTPEVREIRLVPVQVFAAGLCGEDCAHCKTHEGYGLMDAVESWSDCNRAIGKIYRVDEDYSNRLPGESVTVTVKSDDMPFFDKDFTKEVDEENNLKRMLATAKLEGKREALEELQALLPDRYGAPTLSPHWLHQQIDTMLAQLEEGR